MNKVLTVGIAALAVAGVVGAASLSVAAMQGPHNGSGNGRSFGIQKRDGSGSGNRQGGGRQAAMESKAQMLGMTVDELEKALETKTMSQIAKEKGMTEADFKAKMLDAAKARWEARGLSSEEINERLAEREKRQAANSADHEWGSGEGQRQGGYGRNR